MITWNQGFPKFKTFNAKTSEVPANQDELVTVLEHSHLCNRTCLSQISLIGYHSAPYSKLFFKEHSFRGDVSSIPENLMHQQENNFKLIEYKISCMYTKFYTTNHKVEKKLFIHCLSYQDTKLYDTMIKFIIFYIIKYKMLSLAQGFSQHEGTSKRKSRKDEFNVR